MIPWVVETVEDNGETLVVSRDWLASVGQDEFLKVVKDADYANIFT